MIVKSIKAYLGNFAKDKLKDFIGQAFEKRVKKEMKKVTRRLTIRFIVAGVVLFGAFLLINKSDPIRKQLTKPKD